jgi:hypothetical protein
MVAAHEGVGDQGRVSRNSHVNAKDCSHDARNSVLGRMAASGHERRIGANAPAAGRPRTADPARGKVSFRLGPCVDGSGLASAFFTHAAVVGAAMCSAC